MRVGLVEDNNITGSTLSVILSADPAVRLTGAYPSAEAALDALDHTQPDIMLIDLDLPGMHGSELIRRIRRTYPEVATMVYTVFEDRDSVFTALKAGASGYILKGTSPKELLDALQNLHSGGAPMTSRIARKVLSEFYKPETIEANPLSPKESQIVRLIEQGLSYKEISEKLCISSHTVHSHIKNIYEKLHACDRNDALNRARKIGIV